MRYILSLFTALTCVFNLSAQAPKYPVKINFEVPSLADNDVLVAYYFLDKIYVKDTLRLDSKGKALYADSLERGVYSLYSLASTKLGDFIIDKEFTFFMKISPWKNATKSFFTGSAINNSMSDYTNIMDAYAQQVDSIKNLQLPDNEHKLAIKPFDEKIKTYRRDLISKEKNLFGKVLSVLVEPDFKTSYNKEDTAKAFIIYRNAYLNRIDFNDVALLYSPPFMPAITKYLDDLTVNQTDSVIVACDLLLKKSEKNPMMYKSMLIYLLNKYAKSNYMHHENVYVHLVDNYYAKGKASWLNEEELEPILTNAKKLHLNMIGAKAFDFEIPDVYDRSIKLSALTGKAFVILFFDPSCKRCVDALAKLATIEPQFAGKNVRFISVQMAKYNRENPKALYPEYGAEKLTNLILNDGYMAERVKYEYNLTTYPVLYFLDEQKKVYAKRIDVDQLSEILSTYLNNKN